MNLIKRICIKLGVCLKRLRAAFMRHEHYWGVPHSDESRQLAMTCYGCSRTKPVNLED